MPFRPPGQQAITPQGRGRFPGFDVLDQADTWDDATAGVVLARLALPPDLSFFTPAEQSVADPLLDLLVAQDCDPRIPVVALIDNRLAIGETDGWHYDDMPEDSQAWRDTLHFLEADAQSRHGCAFAALERAQQAELVEQVRTLNENTERWHDLPAKQVWSLWTRYACTAFYSHPWAWNEIGFGGPAYPRGYLNPGVDARESWEVADAGPAGPLSFQQRVTRAKQAHDDLFPGS